MSGSSEVDYMLDHGVKAESVKVGEFVVFRPLHGLPAIDWQVWVQDGYDCSARQYRFHRFDDLSQCRFKSPGELVFFDFEF